MDLNMESEVHVRGTRARVFHSLGPATLSFYFMCILAGGSPFSSGDAR